MARAGAVCVEAIPLCYDHGAFVEDFLEQWPVGSDAHRSYYQRIVDGPGYAMEQALRVGLAHIA